MKDTKFESLMYIITSNTVAKVMENAGWDEDYAFEMFTSSKLYTYLEREETKVWHYSTTLLSQLFLEEMEGELVLPNVGI